ncbi:MAG: DNA primase [Methylocystis sp.]|nr:DNA primase [Methylocystis sp.]MCA3583189.1 DNA primase [Methylocystis sp.]MCA3587606.1 DNA primase [Methylocystis sp.]MCA3590733.1 DNA primase [Methylocystis sp.]
MRFPPSVLDEIRARLPVSAVVGRRVKLVKSGREWKGLSPFQAEKTPSFYVNDQKGFYHCFSSGKHGDIFRFVTETEGLSFPETVERLAQEAGVALPKLAPEAVEQEKKRKDLYDVMEIAAKFFEAQLQKPSGAPARAYLTKRQFSDRTQAEFRIGFAPDGRDQLLSHLRAQGVTDRQMIDAGLVIEPDDNRGLYDRFRNRVIIPIQDGQARVVAFGGRVLDPDAKPKYLNSPETALFKKGYLVFNGHRAREAAFKAGTVIATEGYLDAIAVWQAGMRHVVATLGTAFTEEQIATLWRYAPEPIICFDGDKAGIGAANRAIDRILPALKTGYSFRFAILPGGQDPDDLIKAKGIDAFAAVTAKAIGLWDALWQRETDGVDARTPDRQAMIEKSFRDLIGQIGDPLVRRRYELSVRFRLNQYFWEQGGGRRGSKAGARGGFNREPVKLSANGQNLSAHAPRYGSVERIFLGLCIHYPDLTERHRERIATLQLRGDFKSEIHGTTAYDRFLTDVLRVIDQYEGPEQTEFYNLLDPYFMECLDFMHGREDPQRGLLWGHRVIEAFPVLKAAPDEAFMERCFDHFIRLLEFREAEDELLALSTTAAEQLTDAWAERLFQLKRDIEADRAILDSTEQELAEMAAGLGQKTIGPPGLAAAHGSRLTPSLERPPEF